MEFCGVAPEFDLCICVGEQFCEGEVPCFWGLLSEVIGQVHIGSVELGDLVILAVAVCYQHLLEKVLHLENHCWGSSNSLRLDILGVVLDGELLVLWVLEIKMEVLEKGLVVVVLCLV